MRSKTTKTWSAECNSYFAKLVLEKALVAEIFYRAVHEGEVPSLGVTLVETSDPYKDVWLHEKLIEAGYAVSFE